MFGARLPTNPSHYGDAKCSCARCNVFGARLRTRPSHYGMYVCMYVCMYVYLFIRHGYIHKLYNRNENDYIRLKYPVQ